jgi:mannosyltransferase
VLPRDAGLAVLGALIVVAAALRFWGIGHQGFWFDEANTALWVRFTPGEMATLLKHYESTPPFYYGVAWVWAHLFGSSEAELRSLSAVCGVLVVPVSYALGAQLFSRRAGLITAALVATNPLLIWYSQEARAYEMLVLLVGVSLLAFAYARENPSWWALALWTVASGLALSTEYYAGLVVVPEALWLLRSYQSDRRVQIAIGVLAVWSAPLLWFAISQNATKHASWIAHIPLGPRVGQIFPQFAVGFESPAAGVLAGVDEAIAVLALVLLAWLSARRDLRGARLLGGILLAGIVINVLLVAVGIDDLLTRNVVALWLPLAILVAAGLAARPGPSLGQASRRVLGIAGVALAAVLCATGIAAVVGVATDRGYQRPDWRPVAHVLGLRPASGVAQRAILIQSYRDLLPLQLYMPHLRAWAHTGTDKYDHYMHNYTISEFDVIAISPLGPPAPSTGCWWGSACNLAPTQLQTRYPIPGFHVIWIRHSHQFTIMRMVTRRPVVVSPQIVSSALTNTQLKYDDLLLQR